MGCGCANRMRQLLAKKGYVLDRPGGTWRHPNGASFTDEYVQKNHAKMLARYLADRRVRNGEPQSVRAGG